MNHRYSEVTLKVKPRNELVEGVPKEINLELPISGDKLEKILEPYEGIETKIENVKYDDFEIRNIKFNPDDDVEDINEVFDELNSLNEEEINKIYAYHEMYSSILSFSDLYMTVMYSLYNGIEYAADNADEYVDELLQSYSNVIDSLPEAIRYSIDRESIKEWLEDSGYGETEYGYYYIK